LIEFTAPASGAERLAAALAGCLSPTGGRYAGGASRSQGVRQVGGCTGRPARLGRVGTRVSRGSPGGSGTSRWPRAVWHTGAGRGGGLGRWSARRGTATAWSGSFRSSGGLA